MERVEPTQNLSRRSVNLVGIRANLPKLLGALAIVGLIASVFWITVAFLRPKDKPFVMKGKEVELSKDVLAVINGYERRETEGETLKYYIKADKATTFADNHQEFENAYLEAYDETGTKFDKISAKTAVYVPNPENSKLFVAQFSGDVNIETRDAVIVRSEFLRYDRETETAESDESIEFSKENMSGKSFGAIVRVKEKRVELLKDVDLLITEENDIKTARITSGSALIEQTPDTATFEKNVRISIDQKNSAPTSAYAEKIVAHLVNKKIQKLELRENVEVAQSLSKVRANQGTAFFEETLKRVDLKGSVEIENVENGKKTLAKGNQATAFFANGFQNAELTENVEIDSSGPNESPTKIRSQYAKYDKTEDRFELKNGVEIVTSQGNQPTLITASNGVYEQASGKILLTGGAEIKQGNDLVKGDSLTAQLFPNKKLQTAFADGNAYLKQITPERTTEVTSGQLNADFNENQKILNAVVTNNATVSIIPGRADEYSKVTLSAPRSIRLAFRPTQNDSVLSQMLTDGRTTIVMNAPNNDPKSANKKLIADSVKTVLNSNGKDLVRAEAIGNAELYVEPLRASKENYKTTITASRFDCDFFETGNNAKLCIANNKAKAVMQPTVAGKAVRNLHADKLSAAFNQKTQDVERFEAFGNAKFNEADRNGISDQITYTAADEVVRLRGGEPTVFDSRARAKAEEIDWDVKNQKSFLRNKVGTTYYSQRQSNGATPFAKTSSPVYLTADEATFDHRAETGIYTGNARAWQDSNYVRANTLTLFQRESRFEGDGKVQSLLYSATRKENGKTINQPVFAASEKIAYNDKEKRLQYQTDVDIRQGADRITGGLADVYLNANNEVTQTIIQNDVVITQPKRRVRGTWAQYTTADEKVILKGNPAVAEDAEQGTTQGNQITVSLKDNLIVNQGTAKPGGTGRTRTVYKIKNQ